MGLGMFRRRAADGGDKASAAGKTGVEVSAACVSDVGRSRGHNEDNFGEDAKLGLWVVADGMGGHEAGEIASDLAVSHIFRQVADGTSVAEAVSKAHDLIRRAPSQGIGAPGMGTTVVAAQMTGSRYRIYWVGDSRAYLQGSEGLRRLTADHSYVQRLLDQGVITAEQAKIHPERSVITQCLGVEGLPSVQVGETEGELYDGEVLLLCLGRTDGGGERGGHRRRVGRRGSDPGKGAASHRQSQRQRRIRQHHGGPDSRAGHGRAQSGAYGHPEDTKHWGRDRGWGEETAAGRCMGDRGCCSSRSLVRCLVLAGAAFRTGKANYRRRHEMGPFLPARTRNKKRLQLTMALTQLTNRDPPLFLQTIPKPHRSRN